MLELARKVYRNLIFRLLILVIFLMAVFGYAGGRFIFVRAFSSQLNLFPGSFEIGSGNKDLTWQEVVNVFSQDLEPQANFNQFNKNNSAYLIRNFPLSIPSVSDEVEGNGLRRESFWDSESGGQSASSSQSTATDHEEQIGGESDSHIPEDNQAVEESPEVLSADNSDEVGDEISNENDNQESNSQSYEANEVETEENEKTENQPVESAGEETDNSSIDSNIATDGDSLTEPSMSINESAADSVPDFETESTESEVLPGNSNDSAPAPADNTTPAGTDDSVNGETSFLDTFGEKINSFLKLITFDVFHFSLARAQSTSTATAVGTSSQPAEEAAEAGIAASQTTESSLIFTDFSVPEEYSEYELGKINLKLSLAAKSNLADDKLIVTYSLDDNNWQNLGEIGLSPQTNNRLNGDYFLFNLPAELAWRDINHLKIKVIYQTKNSLTGQRQAAVFLDALWLEINYNEGEEEEIGAENLAAKNSTASNFELDLLTRQTHFKTTEEPEFVFRFRKDKSLFSRLFSLLLSPFRDEYKSLSIKAITIGANGKRANFTPKINYLDNGEFEVNFNFKPRQFKPGKYKLKIIIQDGSQTYIASQDFSWGVLALNASKSIYTPGETAYLQMAVLDENGDTLCADKVEYLTLSVKSPSGHITYLSTYNGKIIANPECGPNNVISTPDFYAYYEVDEIGEYEITLTAMTANGEETIKDSFTVAEEVPFEIERIGPTRIYPPALYKMTFRVKVNQDFKGQFVEPVPAGFAISHSPGVFIKEEDEIKKLSWMVNWQAGQVYEFSYVFDAPNVSPEFYLLGPASLLIREASTTVSGSPRRSLSLSPRDDKLVFSETRQWQVAADSIDEVDHYYKNYDTQITKTMNYDTDGWQEVTEYAIPASAFEAGHKYLIIINFAINNSSTNANPMARVRHGTTVFPDSTQRWETRRSADYHCGNGYEYFTVWQAVSGEDIHIDVSNAGGTDYIVRTEGYEATAINLTKQLNENTDWYYATSTHSGDLPTSWTTDGASISFDGAGHDWLVIGLGRFLSDNTSADFFLRLNNATDSTAYSQLRYETEDENDYRPVMTMVGVNFTGTKTWRTEAQVDTASTHDWTDSKIFALNLSRFQDHYIGYGTNLVQLAPQDTWVTATTVPYIASEDADTLIWSQEVVDVGSNVSAAYSRLRIDGTVIPAGHDDAKKELPHGGTDEDAHHNFYLGSLSAGSHTIQVDMYDDTYGSAYADIHNWIIFSLKLAPTFSVLANQQYKSDGVTTVPNNGWSNDADMKFSALAAGVAPTSTAINYYFEIIDESNSFTTSTAEPSSYCSSGTAYNSCAAKIWQATTSVNWYNNNWSYRKAITVNAAQVEDDLTDFPVLISATDSDLAYLDYGGHTASSTGGDIIVTDSDGITLLNFEREYYSSSTGEIILWVKTDLSSSTNKTLYLYYGNSSAAADLATTTGVWTDNYVMVHHFEEPSGTTGSESVTDSAGNANGTPSTGISFGQSGQIGYATDFSSGTGINCGTIGPSLLEATTTISFWIYEYDYGSPSRQNPYNQAYGGWSTMTLETNSNMSWYHGSNGGDGSPYESIYSPSLISNGQWIYVTAVRNPNGYTYKWYRNGSYYSGGSYNSDYPVIADHTFYIGDGYVNPLNGKLDEFRVANAVRSEAWIGTEYNNQNNPSNFLSLGAEEESVFEAVASLTSIPDRGSVSGQGYKWRVLACENGGGCSSWNQFNPQTPNFKVDTTAPTTPGSLTFLSKTSNSVTFVLGDASTDANFDHYVIYYKYGSAGVTNNDTAFIDSNFYDVDYNGATTTTVTGLQSGTEYWFNIFAVDAAGNIASATTEVSATTNEGGRARTVQFLAGTYSGDGTSGQLTDTNNTLPSFNFSLAEHDVSIQNAYLVFEAQFEAYRDYSYDHTGYNLAFDVCQEPCTANAFSGSGRVLEDDNTVLAYRESESNQVRLLLDVTREAQLAAYSGDGAELKAQAGYRIEVGEATSSIASVRAVLVVTYAYDADNSDSITNTVIYPLESTAAGDSGSRLNVQSDDCTLDSTCPTFNYQVDLPEFTTSPGAKRLTQWFQTYGVNDLDDDNDVYVDVNIESNGATSSTFIHEAALAGTQGILPMMYFSDAPGFSENAAQSLEYHIYCPASNANYYLLGGEVMETYIASSSVTVKTRTAEFPLGVITNGSSLSGNKSINIRFPENGRGTGNVEIKKAWLRIISNSATSTAETLTVATKVGNNAQSSNYVYNYNPGGTIIKPTFTVIHIIPAADYTELAKANLSVAKPVTVYITKDNIGSQGGVSATLLITYTYSSEANGYLNTIKLMAGQSEVDPTQSTTTVISQTVLPEPAGTKTMLAGGILASFLLSDSDGSVSSYLNSFIIDTNLATGTPTCSATAGFISRPDSTNSFTEFYKDVSANLTTNNSESYNVCFANNGAGDSSGGAKMNGQFIYTYMYSPVDDLILYIDDQYKSDGLTSIPNQSWTDENEVILSALTTDADASTTQVDFYFQLLNENGDFFTSSDSAPASSCADGTAYNSCSSKIWKDTFTSSSFVPWYNSDWLYRKKITINASYVEDDLSNFSVLATTTDSDLAWEGHGGHMASSTGADLLVTDASGNVLPYEREYYSSSTGAIILWIKTDLSSTTNQDLYLYYGNSNITTDQQNPNGVWDSDEYVMVYHFGEEAGASTVTDSSGNTSGAPSSGLAFAQNGQIGYSIDFSGGTGINCGALGEPLLTASTTISFWIYSNNVSSPSRQNPFEQAYGGWGTMTLETNGAISYFFGSNGGNASPYGSHQSSSGAVTAGSWIYITAVRNPDGYTYTWYKNGDYLNSGTYDSSYPVIETHTFTIGDGYTNPLNARMDEFKVGRVVRSAEWIKTEYNNQSDPASFVSFSTNEESIATQYYQGQVNITSIPDRGSDTAGYKWQVMACDDRGNCADWQEFSISPNFKVDATPPTAPGNLTIATTTPTSVTLIFGTTTTEANFDTYKIFYKEGLSEVTPNDTEHSDPNLAYIDYNGATTTTITGLESATQYVVNIWAYDLADNKTSASEITFTTPAAATARANSIMFFAGKYIGDGTTGQNSDTSQTLSAFNFKLGESDVEIRNAYILFEAQFEAYADNSGDYTGYNLAFDACQEPCTADAWNGTGRVLKDDNTVLAYDETASNQVRLLLDVTDEAQLAAYSGGGTQMEGQVGYRIERGGAVNSIANARAMLVITYAYDEDNSNTLTKTIVYPLESTAPGDSGSRQSSQAANCTKNNNCPTFNYTMNIPEVETKLSQWFNTFFVNDLNNATDVQVNVNIQGVDVDSDTYIHESALAGTQGAMPWIIFDDVYGFSANTSQTLEIYISASTNYLLGGEVAETYLAPASATTKTRTVVYPIGVLTNGQDTSTVSGSVNVYFPENGGGTGVVDIKKAWLRILSNEVDSADYTIGVYTKVGDNSQSSSYAYAINYGGTITKPALTIIHVIPEADYAELESANATTPKTVTVYTTNSSANIGGVSAELVITYTYTSESSGYLTSLDLYGGQLDANGNSQSGEAAAAAAVFPETRGTKTMRAAGLLASYLMSDSDGSMPAAWFSIDANIATDSPVCANAYYHRADGINSFAEFFKNVTSAVLTTDQQTYSVCLSNNGGGDTSAGAKMNAIWHYTYQWTAPPSEFTQSDWRWYENVDSVQPTTAKATENTAISNINLADTLRLRLSVGVSKEDLAAYGQSFKLQYAQASDCMTASGWTDVGPLSGSQDWVGYNNITPTDGDSLSAVLLASSTVVETYEETNPSASNPNAIAVGEYGEWDWVLYDNNATSSADYCFRLVKADGTVLDDYLSDSYPKLTTAPANTAPANPSSLAQYKNDGVTEVANLAWINENDIKLAAAVTDVNINETLTLYFEIATSTASLTTATSTPANACADGTSYNVCSSHIWQITSPSGDYRTTPFRATTTVSNLPESSIGYKWQVLACDDDGECSSWQQFNTATPNFRVDTVAPTAPGALVFATSTPTTITLSFGASTTEANFDRYRIFYRAGISGVTESDNEHSDSDLLDIDYNGTATTTVINLSANTTYVFNIWAYDFAGNKASATVEAVGTTTSSYTPPTGLFSSASQKSDGSGRVDIVIQADDPDNDDTLRARIMYQPGNDCDFSSSSITNVYISEADEDTSANYGDPDVDNNSLYQVGTTSGWIITSPGANYVFFDWFSQVDIPNANGTYCLGLVVNDGLFNQTTTSTILLIVDNVPPSAPGDLTLNRKDFNSVTLNFGAQSNDPRFDRYRIFYKQGISGVTESDTEHTDSNLNYINYNGATTTTISGLSANTSYVFNIWAYDTRGNSASATEITVKTNAAPTNISADNQYKSDRVTEIANGAWTDESQIVLSASAHDQDSGDQLTFYYELLDNSGSFTTATSVPGSTCADGTSFSGCSSKIWAISTTSSSLPADWYDSNWLYRKRITIHASAVAADQFDYPVLATTTDSDLAAYARDDGYDIVFTDSSGTTTIPYEREYFNGTTGELAAWLKTNVSSTTDTVLYMYYGNNQATDQATTTGVWSNAYRGVWHLGDVVVDESSQIGAHLDSTTFTHNGDQYGNNEENGHIGRAQLFDGLNDYIHIGNTGANINTISFWVKNNGAVDLDGGNHTILVNNDEVVVTGFNNPTIYINATTSYSYIYSRRLTINASQIVATESGFVVLATTTDLALRSVDHGGHVASSTGGDIYFTASDGVTKLPYEREKYSSSTGELIAWIKTDISSTSDTIIYMFYGDSSLAADQQNPDSVWGDDYVMVHHFEEPSGTTGVGSVTDSAGNADGTPSGGISFGAAGRVGEAADFSGGTGIDCGTLGASILDATTTISFWLYSYDYGSPSRQNPYNQAYGGWSTMTLETSGTINWYHGDNGGDGSNYESIYASGIVNTTGRWFYIVATRNPNGYTYRWYRDGNYFAGGTYNSSYPVIADQTFLIGDGYTNPLNGRLDEFRVLKTVRDGNWIKTEYNNQSDVNSFISFGTEQIVPQINSGWKYITVVSNSSVLADNLSINKINSTYFNGYIDELRLLNVTQSKDEVRTDFTNQSANADFVSFSSQSGVVSYYETVLMVSIPDSSAGYKWQVMVCDDDGDCSGWDRFNDDTPNFKVDTTPPTAPGALTLNSKTSNSITLNFGDQTTEANFSRYRLFYSTSSPVTESDIEHTDSNLNYIDYNGASVTTISDLVPNTTYYFNIWAYDEVGNKASSTEVAITTNAPVSSPGVAFYTKGSRVLYYRVWDGTAWGAEQTGPTLGSGAGDNIRHIRALRSDDGGKIAILAKTWDGSNQEWWATVYRFAANDFVNTAQLGSAEADATNNQLITGCLAALSGNEFFIVRNNNASDGTLVYSWNATDGWTAEGAGPNPVAVLNGCRLARRPNTDNYLLITYDDDRDVGTAYYYGGSTYNNSWTTWTQHSATEEDADNYVGEGFFDPSDNTRGAFNFTNSATAWNTQAKFFICDNTSINYGAASTSPTVWTDDFVHGEFAADPDGVGVAYFVGDDIDYRLNVLKLDISSAQPTWSTVTNGTDLVGTNLYQYTNDAQKPYAIVFYKSHYGTVVYSDRTNQMVYYRVINASANSVDSSATAVPGAGSNIYPRVRTYKDPNEQEFIAVFQNDDIDYAAAFWDGASNAFYSSGAQAWTELVTGSGAYDADDENIAFAYAAYNSPPSQPTGLGQYKTDATTTIANQGWTNQSSVFFRASVTDPDTNETVKVYLELLAAGDTFTSTTSEPTNACDTATGFGSCSSKIWLIASTTGDFSVIPLVASGTISGIPDSATGYKWQVLACDDEVECSSWAAFNATTPNFRVDTVPPTAPGALTVDSITSETVTLNFGAQTTEDNFDRYRIFYASSTPVTESDVEHIDSDLDDISFNGTSQTTITGLSSSTLYYFNIWAYDLAGNKASATPEAATTTAIGPLVDQVSYRWENDSGADVNSNTAATTTDTALASVYRGERLAARIQINNSGGDIAANKTYKLQFENQTDNPDVWTDVGAATEISYSLGLAGANGDIITSGKAAASSYTWINGTWQENTNQTGNFSLSDGEYTEFVFMIKTNSALAGKTYRLRLYNATDDTTLNSYTSYPTLAIRNAESRRYSKAAVGSLPTVESDLTYYFDPAGYEAVDTDDGTRDNLASSNNYPIVFFAVKHSNNTDAITVTWNGQSSVAASTNAIYLQVYQYGSPNQWVTVASSTTASADTDFTLTSYLNSSLSSYYDGSYWTYWRVYQESGTEILRTDYFNATFSTPTADARQKHYRWRNDDGDETAASWREAEDTGDPTAPTTNIDKGENIRLRIEVANQGAGAASNYVYRLEYATSTGSCAGLTNWQAVTTDGTSHWQAATSSYVANGQSTTAQLANSEGYTFAAGELVAYPEATTSALSLSENYYTEVEFVVQATTNAVTAGTYCFRLTNNGTALDSYEQYPILTLAGSTNSAPYFTVYPSDNGSASTSPTNYGNVVTFTATADDAESDDYYLAICKTNSITAGNDGPPTCDGGEWCIADLASSTVEASCEYTTAESSEELAWYAFVCDKHAGFSIAKCSPASQGSSTPANESPFVINHPPEFTSASTTDNNKDPGGTFTVTAFVTDDDTSGGADTLSLYVCTANSAAAGVGCTGAGNVTLCSQIGTTSPNASCSFSTSTPAAAGTYTYYAFVFDSHNLAASPNPQTSDYTVNNTPPTLGTLVLNNGNDIVLNIKGAGDTAVSTVNANISDLNGCSSLVSANATIYLSSLDYNCTADDNNCYQITTANCVMSDCNGSSDTTATFTCTANLKYFVIPTDNSTNNPNEPYNWLSYIRIYDGENYSATTSDGVELITGSALAVVEDLIDFGSGMAVGENTGTDNATTTIVNYGNSPINADVSGTDMTGVPSGTITVDNIKWSLANFDYTTAGTSLSSTGQIVDLDLSRATTTASDITDQMYWGIGIPYGTDSSVYTGQNSFSVLLDSTGW